MFTSHSIDKGFPLPLIEKLEFGGDKITFRVKNTNVTMRTLLEGMSLITGGQVSYPLQISTLSTREIKQEKILVAL